MRSKIAGVLLLACGGALQAAPGRAQTSLDPDLQIETFVPGLSTPAAMAWLAPDDILVLERDVGRVRRILNGTLLASPVYQAPGGGTDVFLLGIAINTESPPRVFLFEEDQTGVAGNRVARLDWNPTTGQLENRVTIVQIDPSGLAANQDDGGYLLLGPPPDPANPPAVGDGQSLWVVSGYLRKAGQLRNDPAGVPPDDAGVILRVLQDGSPAPGNPFTPYCSTTTTQTCSEDGDCPDGETCLTQVALYWAYGIRNSFGIDIDPLTGLLWAEENGPNEFDELNLVVKGMNSGWMAFMGPDPGGATLFDMPGGGSVYRDPEYSWVTPTGPTGVAFAFGTSFGPAYNDKLLFADFNLPSQIYAMPLDANRTAFALSDIVAETQAELDAFAIATGFSGRAVAIEFGPDGSLYVLNFNSGVIHRITGPGQPPVPALPPAGVFLLALTLGAGGVMLRRRQRG